MRTETRNLALLLLVGGSIGLAASFTLMVEKVHLLTDPGYVPVAVSMRCSAAGR